MEELTEAGNEVKQDGLVERTTDTSSIRMEMAGTSDAEEGKLEVSNDDEYDWNQDLHNPYNWRPRTKAMQVAIIASIGFLAYVMPFSPPQRV